MSTIYILLEEKFKSLVILYEYPYNSRIADFWFLADISGINELPATFQKSCDISKDH